MIIMLITACAFEFTWPWTRLPEDTGAPVEPGPVEPDSDTGPDEEPPPGPPPVDLGPFDDNQVDVLFVIDHSCSMVAYDGTFDHAWSALAPHLEPWDWHLGAVTMDLLLQSQAGLLVDVEGRPFLYEDLRDPATAFQQLVNRGSSGAIIASGLGAAYTALELQQWENVGFRRNAALHLVFVSDKDDETDPELITREAFEAWLDGLGVPVTVHAMVAFSDENHIEAGWTYLELADAYGGAVGDIENPSTYAPFLDELGATLP